MKIKVSGIPEDGLEVDFVKRLDSLGADASAHIALKRMGLDVLVSGQLTSRVPLECGRCLGEFMFEMDVPLELFCSSAPQPEDDEVELSGDELLRIFMEDEIDLDQIVEEQVLLNMPMKPLCSENCSGLCPRCGKDLNKGICKCPDETGDPRLQVLRELLNKGEKE